MRIGIDIDGVLTDLDKFHFDYFSKYCVENNIEYKIGLSNYDISKTFGLGEKEENSFWLEYLDFYAKNEKARPFAAEVIKKLKKDGHKIYIVTARWLTNRDDVIGENMRQTVKEWLAQNNIVYDKLIYPKAAKENKHNEIKENKIDLMIEDSPKNVIEISNIIPTICYDASYNKQCSKENITRCYSWYDIYKTINKIKSGKNSD